MDYGDKRKDKVGAKNTIGYGSSQNFVKMKWSKLIRQITWDS